MATNNEETAAASVASAASLEELRKSAVPKFRQPGMYDRRRIVCNESQWEHALKQLKDSMGEYRALGFDVECVDVNNLKQCDRVNPRQPSQPAIVYYFDPGNNYRNGVSAAEAAASVSRWQSFHRQEHEYCSVPAPLPGSYAGYCVNGRQSPPRVRRPNYALPVPLLPTPLPTKRRKEVAVLLQLASWSGLVVLLRLCYWSNLPESLRHFLSDPRYLKVGVGIEHDAARLLDDWGLELRGWIDLRHLCVDMFVRSSGGFYPFRQMGLKKLAEGLFGLSDATDSTPMSFKKMRALAWSDWNALRLKEEQIRYAAWDAQIAIDIFSLCTQGLFNLSAPQRDDARYYEILYKKCAPYVDVSHSNCPRQAGDDNDDDSADFYNTSMETSPGVDEDELRNLYEKCRIRTRQTGDRGYFSENPPPTRARASTPTVELRPAPTTVQEQNGAAASSSVITEPEPEIFTDQRFNCDVSLNKRTGIAVLTISNGVNNALDFSTLKSIASCLRLLEDTTDCRAVIISSACSNSFSEGFDLKEFRNADRKRLRSYWAAVLDMWLKLYQTRLFTVAAINGISSNGGFVLAAFCDRRVMARDCGVGFNEIHLGITLPLWVIDRVTQLIGFRNAEYILSRGQLLEADAALQYGLVDRITPKDRLLDAAYDELGKILDTPSFSREALKFLMHQPLIEKASQDRAKCIDWLTNCVTHPQTQDILRRLFSSKTEVTRSIDHKGKF